MTVQCWATTMVVFGTSLGLFSYCVAYVQNTWGLVSLGFLVVMSLKAVVDTVDLCCGRLIRGATRPASRAAGRNRADG